MRNNFRTFNLSVEFYEFLVKLSVPRHLGDQLDRAAASITLNLAEGSGRRGRADQLRFYHFATASFRECEAVLALVRPNPAVLELADRLGAHLYNLIQNATIRQPNSLRNPSKLGGS